MKKPLIFEIKGNSLDDGPGIRTVIFMKGCPLSCVWCHNPEGMRPGQEHSYDSKECIGCLTCLNTCSSHAITNEGGNLKVDRSRCSECHTCVSVCPAGALEIVGKELSIEWIVSEVMKDRPFFETSGGGVTLSGGEPTMFMDFCSGLLQEFKGLRTNTLLETCGLFEMDLFLEKMLPWLDMIYFDIKFFDSIEHKKCCGVANNKIIENFRTLSFMKPDQILPRVPLVPGITDTASNLNAIAEFLVSCNAGKVKLLAYNPLWPDKLVKFTGQHGPIPDLMKQFMKPEHVRSCSEIFTKHGIMTI
jgi:pyruvate formate lyase activating enzyme